MEPVLQPTVGLDAAAGSVARRTAVDQWIPDSHRDLIDGPVLAVLTTLMPDGWPQSSLVWFNGDGEHLLVKTARGRRKALNMDRDPRVTLLAADPQEPYRYLEVRGLVVESTEEGAIAHIDELCRLYTGRAPFFGTSAAAERRYTETRLIYKIKPVRVRAYDDR
jgi:PPOX class probable F420-dependent enzyme